MKKRVLKKMPTPQLLRETAAHLMEMPAGEQWIGARDSLMFTALTRIAEWMEAHEQRITSKRSGQR